jgi:hypothetical protein
MLGGRPRRRHQGQAVLPMAEFLRRGRPFGLASAPSSRARSCRIGWTRMTFPSLDSCTDPATMHTSMAVRAQRCPAGLVLAEPLGVSGDHDPGVQDARQAPGDDGPGRLPGAGRADVV